MKPQRLIFALLVVTVFSAFGAYVVWPIIRSSKSNNLADPISDRSTAPISLENIDRPKFHIDADRHDFGTVKQYTEISHRFEIENRGTAPMELSTDGIGCTCFELAFGKRLLAPGEKTNLDIRMQTLSRAPRFEQIFRIKTNDLEMVRGMAEVIVTANIESDFRAEPNAVSLGSVPKGSTASATIFLLSQTWDAFELDPVKLTLEGAQHSVRPATESELQLYHSKSGYAVDVSLDGSDRIGPVSGLLQARATPSSKQSHNPRTLETMVHGEIVEPVQFYGSDMAQDRSIHVSTKSAQDLKKQVNMIVRTPTEALGIERVESQPPGIEAKLLCDKTKSSAPFLCRLQLDIPASALANASADGSNFVDVTFNQADWKPVRFVLRPASK
jgi:Protein of unknown function (DUF1573)